MDLWEKYSMKKAELNWLRICPRGGFLMNM
jgi:hypothetical protein